MHAQIKLGRIAGIEIGLHYSWFIIAALIAFSLGERFRAFRPVWTPEVIWGAAIITAVLFFVTLLLHELAHSLMAKSYGLKVRAITLFALGGVSQIESESPTAGSEFWIAIVGPLTSLAIGLLCIGIAHLEGVTHATEAANPSYAVLIWLGYINLILAGFNMIPGFPLDGGRVLRAIIWAITGKNEKSTRTAARVGQVVGFLFILWGLYQFFLGANLGGLWLAFIGWFLLDAARGTYAQATVVSELRGHPVADLMDRNCGTVEGFLSLRDFVDHFLLHSASRCFIVVQGEHMVGLITANEVKKVDRDSWAQTAVQSVMQPLTQVRAIPPEMPATKALELMLSEGVGQLAVVSNGKLQGIFSRAQVLRFLQLHAGMDADSHDAVA